MKTLRTLLLIALVLPAIFACSAKNTENNTNTESVSTHEINVYYFHFTRRCITCQAVETTTQEILKELYANEMEEKTINFKAINLDEGDSKEIAEKLGVSGQCLLFVKGNEKIDLTSDGFMHARSNPEKLKEIIKETITTLKATSK
jgi:thiol-disulfide isomerase/thioredoxin